MFRVAHREHGGNPGCVMNKSPHVVEGVVGKPVRLAVDGHTAGAAVLILQSCAMSDLPGPRDRLATLWGVAMLLIEKFEAQPDVNRACIPPVSSAVSTGAATSHQVAAVMILRAVVATETLRVAASAKVQPRIPRYP